MPVVDPRLYFIDEVVARLPLTDEEKANPAKIIGLETFDFGHGGRPTANLDSIYDTELECRLAKSLSKNLQQVSKTFPECDPEEYKEAYRLTIVQSSKRNFFFSLGMFGLLLVWGILAQHNIYFSYPVFFVTASICALVAGYSAKESFKYKKSRFQTKDDCSHGRKPAA
jgi:hypothetical protein